MPGLPRRTADARRAARARPRRRRRGRSRGAQARARSCRGCRPRVAGVTNSEGAGASASRTAVALATSHRFRARLCGHRPRRLGQRARRARAAGCSATMPIIRRGICADLEDAAAIGRRGRRPRGRPAQSRPARQAGRCRWCSTRASGRPARPSDRRDHRRVHRAQDELPARQPGQEVFARRHHHRRRSACGRAACARGPSMARGCRRSERRIIDKGVLTGWLLRQRFGAPARARTHRPCRARHRRRAGSGREQSPHGGGQRPRPRS